MTTAGQLGPRVASSWSSRPTTRPTTSAGSSVGSAPPSRTVDVLVVDDNSPDGTGDARRRAGRRRPRRPRAPPAGQGRPRGGVPRRVRLGARRRLRRDRRDGRRRLAPARAAAPAARRAARRRPGDRLALGPRRLGRQLAAAARGALARRQPLRADPARHLVRDATAGFRVFRRSALEKIDLASVRVHRLRLPDRPGHPVPAGRARPCARCRSSSSSGSAATRR